MKLTIKAIPPTINKYIGRTNIWEYQKDKKNIHELIKNETIGLNPRYEKVKMKITYYFKDKRRHDPSNYDKMLLDGLVEANIIVDDNYDVIQEFTTIGKYDKENPRTEIELEEI
jgi:Holliday junction resolvase RusA-like endonuclease